MWKMGPFVYVRDKKRVFIRKKAYLFVRFGVNFTNILPAAFTAADPKSAIKLLNLTVFFALLGSVGVKAARRTFINWRPGYLVSSSPECSTAQTNDSSVITNVNLDQFNKLISECNFVK